MPIDGALAPHSPAAAGAYPGSHIFPATQGFAASPLQAFSRTCLPNECSVGTKKSPLRCEPGQHVRWKNDITPSRNLEFLLWGSLAPGPCERRSKGSTGKRERSPQREKHPHPSGRALSQPSAGSGSSRSQEGWRQTSSGPWHRLGAGRVSFSVPLPLYLSD